MKKSHTVLQSVTCYLFEVIFSFFFLFLCNCDKSRINTKTDDIVGWNSITFAKNIPSDAHTHVEQNDVNHQCEDGLGGGRGARIHTDQSIALESQ